MKIHESQRRMTAVILIGLIAAALLFAANRSPAAWPWRSAPVSLTAEPISSVNKPLAINRNGAIAKAALVAVNADVSGRVSELYVKKGQAVKAGQPLLKLQADPDAAGQTAPGGAQQAQADYDKALSDFNRYQKLYAIGGISRQQFELAAARLQTAKERLAAAGSQTAGPVSDGSATISAPAGGIVGSLTAAAGKTVQAGQQLLTLGSGHDLEARIELSQNDLYLVHLGAAVVITVAQQALAGQVYKIEPQAAAADQPPRFLAYVRLAAYPAELLHDGMAVAAKFDSGKTAAVAAVPGTAVFQDDQGQSFIYLAVNGKAVLQPVEIGENSGDYREISTPLPPQSLVITSHIAEIKDGAAINLLP